MITRGQSILTWLQIGLFAAALGGLATCTGPQPQADLPDIAYMCPMLKDADVLEEHPGKCPKCGMELKPVRIVTAYSCLNNTAFMQEKPGTCPTNHTDLVPITASMFWICPAAPDKHELQPGKCADGSDRIRKLEPRLHGDHNPRHGGQLFMADDAWHHLEGTHPSPSLFRVFFYDDWTRPLAPEGFTARLILKDSEGKELEAIALQPSPILNAMEGKIPRISLPLNTSLQVRFKTGEPEKLFDFRFNDYSKEPGELTSITKVPEATAPPAPAPYAPAPAAVALASVGTFQVEPIPANTREILAELDNRNKELAEKIKQRAPLGEYWVPALRTKDLALALVNDHSSEIPSRQRPAAENAAGRLLRAAYAIDNFGDLGDFEKILSAYDEFAVAVNDLRSVYASIK